MLHPTVCFQLVGITGATDSELAHTEEELRLILAHDTHVSATTRNIALNATGLSPETSNAFDDSPKGDCGFVRSGTG